MPFHTEVIVVLMVFMTVEIAVEIAVHTVVTVVWIVFNTEETAVEMAVQMVLKVVWILVSTVVKNPDTAVNTVVATLWIAETVFEKKLLILPQTVCQSVPNSPRNTSSALFNAVRVVENTDFTPSQILEKIPFAASHAPLQLPENTLEKTSNRPSKVSRTTPRMVAIFWNAPSNSGAST